VITKIKFNRVGVRYTIATGTILQYHFNPTPRKNRGDAYDFMRFESNSTLKMYEKESPLASSYQRQTSHDEKGQLMTSEGQLMTEKDKCYRHKTLGVRRRAKN
jgi:hypothetical protein